MVTKIIGIANKIVAKIAIERVLRNFTKTWQQVSFYSYYSSFLSSSFYFFFGLQISESLIITINGKSQEKHSIRIIKATIKICANMKCTENQKHIDIQSHIQHFFLVFFFML